MNVQNIKTAKIEDGSVFARCTMVARAMYEAGMWDGQRIVVFTDGKSVFNRVFGLDNLPVTQLVAGTDYIIQ